MEVKRLEPKEEESLKGEKTYIDDSKLKKVKEKEKKDPDDTETLFLLEF